MRATQYTLVDCQFQVQKLRQPNPENPAETAELTVLVISNPHQAETYLCPLSDELRRTLARELAGGIQMAASLKEVR